MASGSRLTLMGVPFRATLGITALSAQVKKKAARELSRSRHAAYSVQRPWAARRGERNLPGSILGATARSKLQQRQPGHRDLFVLRGYCQGNLSIFGVSSRHSRHRGRLSVGAPGALGTAAAVVCRQAYATVAGSSSPLRLCRNLLPDKHGFTSTWWLLCRCRVIRLANQIIQGDLERRGQFE